MHLHVSRERLLVAAAVRALLEYCGGLAAGESVGPDGSRAVGAAGSLVPTGILKNMPLLTVLCECQSRCAAAVLLNSWSDEDSLKSTLLPLVSCSRESVSLDSCLFMPSLDP